MVDSAAERKKRRAAERASVKAASKGKTVRRDKRGSLTTAGKTDAELKAEAVAAKAGNAQWKVKNAQHTVNKELNQAEELLFDMDGTSSSILTIHSLYTLYAYTGTSSCTVLTIHPLCSLHCTHYTVLTTLYSPHCTHHTVLTTLYSLYQASLHG
jgi:hypothetical protein